MNLMREGEKDLVLDSKFFLKIAANVVARYNKHIFDPKGNGSNAKQVDGKSYPAYTTKYKETKFKKGDSKFAQSKAPVFSRALLNDFQGFKLIGGGFRFGTPIQGAKVKHLANMGRVISSESKPIPKPVEKYILSEADKYVKKELSKIKGRTFNIG